MKKAITVVVRDDRREWPLIYDVEIDVMPSDATKGIDAAWDHSDEIMEKVSVIRGEETEEEPGEASEHLELLFAFEGNVRLALDWRM